MCFQHVLNNRTFKKIDKIKCRVSIGISRRHEIEKIKNINDNIYFDEDERKEIQTDASKDGIRAVLTRIPYSICSKELKKKRTIIC